MHRSVAEWVALLAARHAGRQQQPVCRGDAEGQLRVALPLAAAANSDDGSWNSLMTTISEISTVDEGHLVPALRAQCVVADSNPNVNPQSPSGGSGGGPSGGGGGGGGGGGHSPPTGNVNPNPASG